MVQVCQVRYLRVGVPLLIIQALVFAWVKQSEARSLKSAFAQGYAFPTVEGIGTTTQDGTSLLGFFTPDGGQVGGFAAAQAAQAIAPAIAAAVAQSVTQQFPLASVAPAFTYRFNPTLSIYERSTGVPGPLFSERVLTLGKGQLNFGVGYSYVDFDTLNGDSMDNITSPGLLNELFVPDAMSPDGLVLFPFSLSQLRTRINVQAHVIVPSVRYGITDNWDVSLAIPILNTFVRVRNEVRRTVNLNGRISQVDQDGNIFYFDPNGNRTLVTPDTFLQLPFIQAPFTSAQLPSARLAQGAASATGIGDISLRTKYHFWRTENGGAAFGLNLIFPSGDVDDFQGTDEMHVAPFLYFSQVMWDRFEPHANVGIDFNADDVDRSSFVYAVGATFLIWDRLGFSFDFIGRSEFGRFPVRIPPQSIIAGTTINRPAKTCTTAQPCTQTGNFPSFPIFPEPIKRNDIDDFSFGLRYALGTSGSIFFGGIIPINRDGFRSDFIPSGGIEYSF